MTTRPLTDRTVLITGGSSGIGRVTAHRLADRGAHVVTCARDADRLGTLAAGDARITPVVADLTDAADRERLVDTVLATHGRIDALVNNAGIGWVGPVEEISADAVRRLVDTNLTAVLDLTRLVLPDLLRRGAGDIVMISSAAAWFPVPGLTAYAATKAGVEGFVGGLRREVGPRGVLVHSVNPGPVRTEWLPRSAGDRAGEDQQVTAPGPGVPPEWVSRAVEQCLTRTWARTLGVPRAVELSRLTVIPGVNRLVDAGLGLVAPRLTTWARQLADARTGD